MKLLQLLRMGNIIALKHSANGQGLQVNRKPLRAKTKKR
jgi:hypothetical protein